MNTKPNLEWNIPISAFSLINFLPDSTVHNNTTEQGKRYSHLTEAQHKKKIVFFLIYHFFSKSIIIMISAAAIR